MVRRLRGPLALSEADAVRRLAHAAALVDGDAPLSEQTLLNLSADSPEVIHLLAVEGAAVAGYAQVITGSPASAELVVDPMSRRCGHGSALLAATLELDPATRVWRHGQGAPGAAFAMRHGLTPVRELLVLERPLSLEDEFPTHLPAGYTLSTYTPADAADWLALNAQAFAGHPEQGRISADDLAARTAEAWFDPAGFFLVRDPGGEAAGFHWTKVVDGVGEVYVVGVGPRHQGLGLGKAVTAIGLAHLRDRGLGKVTLYVDGANVAARETYAKLGFHQAGRHAQVAREMSP